MIQQRINRRTSFGSNTSLRRSSVSSKDIQAIQLAMQSQQPFSSQALLALLISLPLGSFIYLHSVVAHRCALQATLWSIFKWPWILNIFPPLEITAIKFVLMFYCIQVILYHILPHDQATVLTPAGEQIRATNGLSSLLLVLLLYVLGAAFRLYPENFILINFQSIIFVNALLCVLFFGLLALSYRLGEYYNITTLNELCFGVELEPTLLDMDVKHMLRTRIALPMAGLCAVAAINHQLATQGKCTNDMLALTTIQLAYVARRLWQEQLELNSLDAQKNKLGFIRMWTDMVWTPIFFFAPIGIMSQNTRSVSALSAALFGLLGHVFVIMTGIVNSQKFEFRKAKGDLKIKGVDAFFIAAKYKTDSGDTGCSLLLGSGYWSYVRHPNYLTEMIIFLAISLLQGRVPWLAYVPLFYVIFFLFLRMYYDEQRCLAKYGQSWIQHCSRVRAMIIPGLF